MPNLSTTQRYKKQKLENVTQKRAEQRVSRKEHYNNYQKMLMRSRRAKFTENTKTDQAKIRKRDNTAVKNSRLRQSQSVLNRKRKIAKRRWVKCQEEYEKEIRDYLSLLHVIPVVDYVVNLKSKKLKNQH